MHTILKVSRCGFAASISTEHGTPGLILSLMSGRRSDQVVLNEWPQFETIIGALETALTKQDEADCGIGIDVFGGGGRTMLFLHIVPSYAKPEIVWVYTTIGNKATNLLSYSVQFRKTEMETLAQLFRNYINLIN